MSGLLISAGGLFENREILSVLPKIYQLCNHLVHQPCLNITLNIEFWPESAFWGLSSSGSFLLPQVERLQGLKDFLYAGSTSVEHLRESLAPLTLTHSSSSL